MLIVFSLWLASKEQIESAVDRLTVCATRGYGAVSDLGVLKVGCTFNFGIVIRCLGGLEVVLALEERGEEKSKGMRNLKRLDEEEDNAP